MCYKYKLLKYLLFLIEFVRILGNICQDENRYNKFVGGNI